MSTKEVCTALCSDVSVFHFKEQLKGQILAGRESVEDKWMSDVLEVMVCVT